MESSSQIRRPRLTRLLDAAHKTAVVALLGSTCFLGYLIYSTLQGHKRAIKEATSLANVQHHGLEKSTIHNNIS